MARDWRAALGDEETLAGQLTSELGLELQEWRVEFVRAQVKAAVQMSDLERRAQGSASSASMQRIADAVRVAEPVIEEISRGVERCQSSGSEEGCAGQECSVENREGCHGGGGP